jgi:hypothetical protein
MAEKRFVNKKIGSRPIFCKPDCNHLEFIHFIALYILISIERVAFRFAIKALIIMGARATPINNIYNYRYQKSIK